MKKEAKGDEKVPQEKRVYLFVEAEARTTSAKIPKGTFWYSKVCVRTSYVVWDGIWVLTMLDRIGA